MAYCQNCGAEMNINANFCPNCGAAVGGNTAPTQNASASQSDTAKTVLTAAGTAAGISLLGNVLRKRRRRFPAPPPHGGMHGLGRGPGGMGGPGRGPGGMGGPGRR